MLVRIDAPQTLTQVAAYHWVNCNQVLIFLHVQEIFSLCAAHIPSQFLLELVQLAGTQWESLETTFSERTILPYKETSQSQHQGTRSTISSCS